MKGSTQSTYVILAEDNHLMGLFLSKALAPAADQCFALLPVGSAAEAFDCFDYWRDSGASIGGAIVDYDLGDATSENLVRHYRMALPDMPIILSSVFADDRSIQERMSGLGVSSFISKPYAARDICGAFARHICPASSWRLPGHTCFAHLSDQPGHYGGACYDVPRRIAGAYSLLGAPAVSGRAA